MPPNQENFISGVNVSTKRFPFSTRTLIFGAIGAAVVALGLLLLFGQGDGSSEQAQRLSARLGTLSGLVQNADQNIKSGDLRKVNSEARIVILGNVSALKAPLAAAGAAKLDKKIVAAEADTATSATLNDAAITGKYDSAYARALNQKLESTGLLMLEISQKTKSRALKAALQKAAADFVILQQQLTKLGLV